MIPLHQQPLQKNLCTRLADANQPTYIQGQSQSLIDMRNCADLADKTVSTTGGCSFKMWQSAWGFVAGTDTAAPLMLAGTCKEPTTEANQCCHRPPWKAHVSLAVLVSSHNLQLL